MIRVYVELLPGGSALAKKTIARFDVWNTTELAPVSNYAWEAEVRDEDGRVRRAKGRVEHHARELGALELVRRVMIDATAPRETVVDVTPDERIVDLASHLFMMALSVESRSDDPDLLAVAKKAREALRRSGK